MDMSSEKHIYCLDDLDDDDSSAGQGSTGYSKRPDLKVQLIIKVSENWIDQHDVHSPE